MNTPTPETDAAELTRSGWVQHIVPTEFARKLERERDEAREKAERYRTEANAKMMQRDQLANERDELKLKLAYLEADNQEHIKRDMQRTGEVEQLRKVADELASELKSELLYSPLGKQNDALDAYNELPHVKKS